MSARPEVGVFLQSASWNGTTWDAADGGIQGVDDDRGSEMLAHWAGSDIYPRLNVRVREQLEITLSVDDASPDIQEGDMSDLVFVMLMGDLTTQRTVTAKNMKLARLTHSQSEANAGNYRLRFVHESDDGVSNPVSVS